MKLGKRIVFMVLLLSSMMFASVCVAAAVSDSEISIGGISYGASADYVKSVYGEPDRVTRSNGSVIYDGPEQYYIYGNSFKVEIGGNKVVHISTTANNGLGTPAGVTVGMDRKILDTLYGSPKNIMRDKNGYITGYYYRSERDNYIGLRFEIRSGKIRLFTRLCG